MSGSLPHVETETAFLSDVVGGNQIQNLVLDGRIFTALALLVSAAAPDNMPEACHTEVTANLNISFNGSSDQYNNWEPDSDPKTDDTSASTTDTFPNIDSIAESRISTLDYGADVGRHGGAVIEVASKSWTKDFDGSLFEFLRNDKLDANDWFVNRQRGDWLDALRDSNGNPAEPCTAPETQPKWNDYGYALEGSFLMPGH